MDVVSSCVSSFTTKVKAFLDSESENGLIWDRYKKNVKHVYIVHPQTWVRVVLDTIKKVARCVVGAFFC